MSRYDRYKEERYDDRYDDTRGRRDQGRTSSDNTRERRDDGRRSSDDTRERRDDRRRSSDDTRERRDDGRRSSDNKKRDSEYRDILREHSSPHENNTPAKKDYFDDMSISNDLILKTMMENIKASQLRFKRVLDRAHLRAFEETQKLEIDP